MKKKDKPVEIKITRVKPLPELHGERPFKVIPGNAMVEHKTSRFYSPLGPEDYNVAIRAHEYGHLQWPAPGNAAPGEIALKNGVSVASLQVCEDARINHLLAQHGVKLDYFENPKLADMGIKRLAQTGDFVEMVKYAVARHCVKGEQRLINKHYEETPVGRLAIALAERIVKIVTVGKENRRGQIAHVWGRANDFESSVDGARRLDQALKVVVDPIVQSELEAMAKPKYGLLDRPGLLTEFLTQLPIDVQWGECRTKTAPGLVVPCKPSYRGFHVSYDDHGAIMRAPHRVTTDGRIFTTRHLVKDAGGSLLIDCSSSMAIDWDQLKKFLAASPLATVALYGSVNDTHTIGEVLVVAQRGRRISTLPRDRFCGGNVIDGPALRWLGRQSKPRVWIGDGGVTGQGDVFSVKLKAECELLCRAHQVTRFDALNKYLKA